MDHHEIVCREFVELVTEYRDGALPPRTLDLVEEHLVMCDWCVDYLSQMDATVGIVRHVEVDAPPAEMLEALLADFRDHVSKEA